MKKISFIFLLIFCSLTTFSQVVWKSDKAHSQLKFDVIHWGITTVSGAFEDFDATITQNKSDFSDAKFELTAKANSINTGIEKRNDHLKSPDFFDVEANPDITFVSTSLKSLGNKKYLLIGDLKMHGITKKVTLELVYRGSVENPMNKKMLVGFRATGKVKRSDFGIGPKFVPPMISEEVSIIVDGQFGVAE